MSVSESPYGSVPSGHQHQQMQHHQHLNRTVGFANPYLRTSTSNQSDLNQIASQANPTSSSSSSDNQLTSPVGVVSTSTIGVYSPTKLHLQHHMLQNQMQKTNYIIGTNSTSSGNTNLQSSESRRGSNGQLATHV